MKNTIFTGAGVAIVTPMNADGSVNYEALGDLIEIQIKGKTDAIIICGTTGESSTLTDEEHRECIRYTIEKVNHRIPVIAGTGSNDTAYAIELSKEADSMGADGLLLVSPYYNKASQKGLIAHYTAIADAVNIPCILYNVPSRTGCNILPETMKVLGQHKNIAAVKEASGNISQIAKIFAECGDLIDVYSGNDDQIVPIMSLGGKGVISVLSNVAPEIAHNIAQLCLDNNFPEAAAMAARYLRLCNALFCDVNPIPVKEALNMMGFPAGPCRLPLCETEDSKKEIIRAALSDAGLLK
ncbi:MAG: 4-hydroxy-tetrahydrodipicolinate synthase [Oscillospiraceae bacterium]|nr:4-hydroxy-tetrahydrodipicolinate synthase [Oscillospiraceae bacterium]